MTEDGDPPFVEMRGISKRYGDLLALEGVDLEVRAGEAHALVGENGAGKSTLVRVLCGLTLPTSGRIRIDGRAVPPGDPKASLARGIAIVQQHFALVPTLTVAENVVLGAEPARGPFLDRERIRGEVSSLIERLAWPLRPEDPAGGLAVGQRQAVEILKALYRRARCLVLDEPTAALSPPEAERLFEAIRRLRGEGVTLLLVTHRMEEVLRRTDRATVLRRGRVAGRFESAGANEADLARAIVGEGGVPEVRSRRPAKEIGPLLEVRDLVGIDDRGIRVLDGVSFRVGGGEIVGLAGVAGNGQSALARALTGRMPVASGDFWLNGENASGMGPESLRSLGVAEIPEDRDAEGLVSEFSVVENAILGEHRQEPCRSGIWLDRRACRDRARDLVEAFDVRAPDLDGPVRGLSGGNRQKLLVGRELGRRPSLVVAAQPTRGLDIRAAAFARDRLVEARDRGAGVLLISQDLEEILALSDRVLVMVRGRIAAEVPGSEASEERLGALMTGPGSAR